MSEHHSTGEPGTGNALSSDLGSTSVPWWRRGVVYQVYVRSFADGNSDGTGDINGLRSRLPYLRDLGIDALWVNPWYQSPLNDGGYDVSDYRQIEPRYGSIADAEAFIAEAHDFGIRVIIDLVPNHTSSEHRWFAEALAAPIGDPARQRYHIRPGRGVDESEPPTNWTSVFGGPAWTRLEDGEWFLHLFDPSQPDLNWENPEVRDEFESVFRFWLDRGVDGFRVDVAHGLIKDMSFPDMDNSDQEILGGAKTVDHPFWDLDGVHEIIRDWRVILDEYSEVGAERMMVAEAWVATPERLANYLRPDEYQQSFNFDLLASEWDAASMQTIIVEACTQAAAVGSTPTWVLSNHDVVRHATRYGLPIGTDWRRWLLEGPHDALDVELGQQRARAAALLLLGLPGSSYIYQGDELGLDEVWDLPVEVLDDPVWEQSSHTRKGRDGCRVPLPWKPDGPSFGFGDEAGWLPQPERFSPISAASQHGDADSMLELYRLALSVRREHLIGDESIQMLEVDDSVVAFKRGSGVQCWLNLGKDPVALPETLSNGGKVLARSFNSADSSALPLDATLPGNSAIWFTQD